MDDSLLRSLAANIDDYERSTLLREFATRTSGIRRFTFNLFNVVLDFDADKATIEGLLEADGSYSLPLTEFKRNLGTGGKR
ncbi:MAG: hypothetical protein E6I73_11060 [Chloroflexi bacterium]|nr:MAG: hypothetical protein E6I73_11060 [Chloroflexota bacterium]